MLRQPIRRAPGATPIGSRRRRRRPSGRRSRCRGRRRRTGRAASEPQRLPGGGVVDRVVPVVGVRGRDAVQAAVLRLQRGMLPRESRVRVADDDALAREAAGPELGRADLLDVRLDRRRRRGARARPRRSRAAARSRGSPRRAGPRDARRARRASSPSASTSIMLTRKCGRTATPRRAAPRERGLRRAPPRASARRRRTRAARRDRGSRRAADRSACSRKTTRTEARGGAARSGDEPEHRQRDRRGREQLSPASRLTAYCLLSGARGGTRTLKGFPTGS